MGRRHKVKETRRKKEGKVGSGGFGEGGAHIREEQSKRLKVGSGESGIVC